MPHVYVRRSDVVGTLRKFLETNMALTHAERLDLDVIVG